MRWEGVVCASQHKAKPSIIMRSNGRPSSILAAASKVLLQYTCCAVILFCVSVPVLSEQMTDTQPKPVSYTHLFKAAQLTSNFIKKGYDVEVIMTKNATEFITPLTFESLTKHNVMVSTFEKVADRSVKHISIAQRADIFVIVPATANVIAKIAHGIADDMLTTTFLAASCKKVICPAMNTGMYENPITQKNLDLCRSYGYEIFEPASGFLACGDIGKGKLEDITIIEERVEQLLMEEQLLTGKHVLVTAGPTQEALDPVRYLTNHSTGKMGYEIARAAKDMGAEVTLISGPTSLAVPAGVKLSLIHI